MSSLVEVAHIGKPKWSWFIAGILATLVVSGLSIPGLYRSRDAAERANALAHQQMTVGLATYSNSLEKTQTVAQLAEPVADAALGRKIIRTSSLEMVVQHPAEAANRIASIAEGLGGYIVSAADGGEKAKAAILTIRVPAAQFELARAEIRKIGVTVESEKIDTQDVTSQYVDQDATLRNLKAEEAQYLGILKQATTVKDMLSVSEKLSEVRGQIEQQQAEFNTLSQQIEAVAITISLRTEAEAKEFGLNWRPWYQIKLAAGDGLEGIATYVSAMTAILFYVPTVLLWIATILIALLGGFKTVNWIGRRWLGWNTNVAPGQ